MRAVTQHLREILCVPPVAIFVTTTDPHRAFSAVRRYVRNAAARRARSATDAITFVPPGTLRSSLPSRARPLKGIVSRYPAFASNTRPVLKPSCGQGAHTHPCIWRDRRWRAAPAQYMPVWTVDHHPPRGHCAGTDPASQTRASRSSKRSALAMALGPASRRDPPQTGWRFGDNRGQMNRHQQYKAAGTNHASRRQNARCAPCWCSSIIPAGTSSWSAL